MSGISHDTPLRVRAGSYSATGSLWYLEIVLGTSSTVITHTHTALFAIPLDLTLQTMQFVMSTSCGQAPSIVLTCHDKVAETEDVHSFISANSSILT